MKVLMGVYYPYLEVVLTSEVNDLIFDLHFWTYLKRIFCSVKYTYKRQMLYNNHIVRRKICFRYVQKWRSKQPQDRGSILP